MTVSVYGDAVGASSPQDVDAALADDGGSLFSLAVLTRVGASVMRR